MTLQILLAILGSIGGWELIRYVLDWIKKRRSTSKIDIAEAEMATQSVSDKAISILNDTVDFQKGRIDDLEKQLNEQGNLIKELRKIIDDNYTETNKLKNQLEKVCLRITCKNRIVIDGL